MLGRIARSLLALVGALALVAGVVGALYVGPDDDVLLPASRSGSEPGQLVVTAPELLSYDDLTLVVRARADGGVLLAAGNPVDVTSLADQVEHWEVTGVRFGGVTGGRRVVAATHPVPLGDLASSDLWTDHAEGEGWQELRLHLDGGPVQLLAAPTAEEVPELQVGAHVGGLFWVLVTIVGGGAMLLGIAVTLMVRARRRRRPGRAGALVAPALAVALLATGCGLPHAVFTEAPPSRIALEPDDLDAMLASYDELNNRAIRAADAPRYAIAPWRAVDAGPILEHDIYSTVVARRSHDRTRSDPYTHDPVRVYSPRLTSYPMWSAVVSGDQEAAQVEVFTRATAASPWLMRTSSTADLDDLPDALDPDQAREPEEAAVAVARDAVAATTRYLATGVLRGVHVTDTVRALHREATRVAPEQRKSFHSQHLTVDSTAAERQDDLRIVAVDGGHLALAVRPARLTFIAPRGMTLRWNSVFRKVDGSFGQEIYREFNLCVVVFVPSDGGTPRALAADALPARA